MPRPLIGDEPLTEQVKFRLTASELAQLRALAGDENLSTLLRSLVRDETTRRKIL